MTSTLDELRTALIDGEALVLRPDGHSDFRALRSRAGAAAAIMVAFDLVEHGWRDLRKEPVEQRRGVAKAD